PGATGPAGRGQVEARRSCPGSPEVTAGTAGVRTARVYLVGAGPGDPRLLTLRGAEVLRTADVVVHDRLAPAALLDLAPARAARIDVGKEVGRCLFGQDDINRLLVERAREGKTVVRLKGGDPF